jgi:hypothetical protein
MQEHTDTINAKDPRKTGYESRHSIGRKQGHRVASAVIRACERNVVCGDKSGPVRYYQWRARDAYMINSSKQIPHCPAASC